MAQMRRVAGKVPGERAVGVEAAEPPVLIARIVEQQVVATPAVEVAHPEGTPIRDLPQARRVPGLVPGQRAVGVEAAEPPVLIARIVEQEVVAALAVEVADPEGAPIRNLAEAHRVGGQVPVQHAVAADAAEPPVLVSGIVEQEVAAALAIEVADPEGAPIRDLPQARGVPGEGPVQEGSRGATGVRRRSELARHEPARIAGGGGLRMARARPRIAIRNAGTRQAVGGGGTAWLCVGDES